MVCQTAMNSNDVGALLGVVQWADEGSYVKEASLKTSLPQLAKIIKGQYLSVGVPSLTNSSLTSNLLLFSSGKSLRVLAQCVKFKEGRRAVAVGPKLAIPDSYEGYFEILSEDGRSVRSIESVSELFKRFPDSCLVREPIKVYVSKSDDIEAIKDRSRLVQTGETLVLVGEVRGLKNGKSQPKFLRCFDQTGQNIYLPFEARGKFSPIAKEDNISGVHSMKKLLNKRLPMMVRLIHGRLPVGPKVSSQFVPELRLFTSFSEECLTAVPIGKDAPAILLPPSAPLKLLIPKNTHQISALKSFQKVCERAVPVVQDLSEKIHIYDVSIENKNLNIVKDPRFFNIPNHTKPHKNIYSHLHKGTKKSHEKLSSAKRNSKSLDDYDEIDQIYDYVRGIAPLPKHLRLPNVSKEANVFNRRHSTISFYDKDVRPPPPPIETIPSRKLLANGNDNIASSIHPALITAVLEKTERKSDKKCYSSEKRKSSLEKISPILPNQRKNEGKNSSKIFVKASQQKSSKNRMIKQKTSSFGKESIPELHKRSSLPTNCKLSNSQTQLNISPQSIFKMRYKSLTNLTYGFDTMNSLNSAEKGSSGSNTSFLRDSKMSTKKTHKLMRPKSMTNLAVESRGSSTGGDSGFTGMSGAGRTLLDAEKKLRLEPGVYRHAKDAPALLAATNRLLSSQRKIGNLYL